MTPITMGNSLYGTAVSRCKGMTVKSTVTRTFTNTREPDTGRHKRNINTIQLPIQSHSQFRMDFSPLTLEATTNLLAEWKKTTDLTSGRHNIWEALHSILLIETNTRLITILMSSTSQAIT